MYLLKSLDMENFFGNELTQENIYFLAALIPLLLQLGGMSFAVLSDNHIEKKHRRILLLIVFLLLLLIAQNYQENRLALMGQLSPYRMPVAIMGYVLRPVILVLFLYIVSPHSRYIHAWILTGINALVYMTNPLTKLCFTLNGNHYHGGPLGNLCLFVSILLIGNLLLLIVRDFTGEHRRELGIPLLNVLIVLACLCLDYSVGYGEQYVTFLTEAAVSGSVFFYIWLHQQFVREHEEDLKAQQRIQIMTSQIQPHFMYNTIATFKALCHERTDEAAELAEKFGTYLRENMDSLNYTGCIPFRRELEHTRLYTDIERVRFENIRVEYDIADEDFELPPLSLQPMVENAIRHGVRVRKEGVVRVESRRTEKCHELVITDNGKGFDVQSFQKEEGQHIGIKNVRERIESMCGGSVTIESEEGRGTIVTIRIPHEGRE